MMGLLEFIMNMTVRTVRKIWAALLTLTLASTSFSASLDRKQLSDRCRSAFAIFDYQSLITLKAETESFLSEQNDSEPIEVIRCNKKLSLYLNYYHLNIVAKGRSLLDWNYYRLIFDAIANIDQRRIISNTESRASSSDYYALMYQEAIKSLEHAVSYYRHYFPFIDWTLAEGQDFDSDDENWESLDMFMTALAQAIGELNHRHAKVREARKVSVSSLRKAQRELLEAYDLLMQTPFRVILTPYLSRANTTEWKDIRMPSPDEVRKALLDINRLFKERLVFLESLYENKPAEDFALYLIESQSQTFAEFMVNYPEFFSTHNYHLDLIDIYYQRQEHSVPAMHYVALVSSVMGITLAALHEVSTPKTTSLLYFFSVFGGLGATLYLALADKSLAQVLPLRKQLHSLRTSILLGQSDAYRYLISRDSSYRNVRNKAFIQSLLFGSYAALMLRGLSQLKTLSVANKLDDPISAYRQAITRTKRLSFKGFDMADIEHMMKNNAHPERLSFQERMRILDSLFKHRHDSYTVWRKNLSHIRSAQDLSIEQVKSLYTIGEDIAGRLDPLDTITVQKFMRQMELDERIATLNLERIRNYMLKIFQIQRRPYAQTF